MEHSSDHYYDICKWYLMLVGQWPYQKLKESLSFLTFILILDASALVTQIARFVICDNALCIYETLPPHMLTVMILVKIFTYQFNSRKIKDLTDRLFVDWDMIQTKEEHDIMKKYAQNGRWYALTYGSYVYVSTISFTTTSLVPRILDVVFPLNTSRPVMLAYPAYYFVDENQYFYYIFLHMLITSSVCMTGLIAHDSMFFVYVEHICGLFAIVGFRFEHVSYKPSAMEKSMIDYPDAVYHKNIVISIHAHRQALQFAKLLEDTFTISFAVQLLIVTVGLSITLVQLSIQLHDSAEAMRYFVFIIAQLFHLFCLSFQGQKLINHSLETCDKIYHSLWFTIPVKEQRLLLFAMKRSLEASILTAGKIYVFSLESFTTIKHLTDRLFIDWDMLKTKEEHNIMRKYAETGRWYALIYGSFVYMATTIFASTALVPRILDVVFPLNTSRPVMFPYPAYYFVDENEYFYYIFCLMLFTGVINMTGLIAHDITFFVYIEHVCGLFAIVGFSNNIISRSTCRFRLEHLLHKRSAVEKNMLDYPDAVYHKNIVISIYIHNKALQFVEFLENTFTISFAVQVLFVTITLSITLVQVSYLRYKSEALRYFLFISGQLFHLFCLSFQGQKLIDHSLETCDKIYCGRWYTIPVKEQGLLRKYELSCLCGAEDATLLFHQVLWKPGVIIMTSSIVPSLTDIWLRQKLGMKMFCVALSSTIAPQCVNKIERKRERKRDIVQTIYRFHFKSLFCNCDEAMEITNDFNNTYRKRVAFFVHAHREALKFAELLEDTFTIPFAIQMSIATVGISITLLQITQQGGDIVESIRYVLYVIGQLIHLFFLSFEGQKLIDHSLQTCDKIYSSSWYEASIRSQKLIVLVMMKSVRPSFLSAGKVYIFSLESFTTVTRAQNYPPDNVCYGAFLTRHDALVLKVLQTSMSYFTVLASFQ
ncbi:uncharacterized protein [Temnothorax nylanderi]|uniref:uncharacterized protein n=1 Tax=Temnothorax nylanderi TaxID=102681 RepID=UPI003A848B12